MDITGASAIVTGGASGIGAASARLLAERGAKVVVADLQEDKGKELADEIGGAFAKVDVTNTDDIINAVEMAKSMGPVRVLVNSAGIGWAQRTVGKDGSYDSAANLDAFKRVIAINLIGTFDCHPPRRHGDEHDRAAGVGRAGCDRQHRLRRRLRRADRPGQLLGVQGRHRRDDAARSPATSPPSACGSTPWPPA